MKRCLDCSEEKPLEDFYPHPRMADGHLNKCKSCVKRRVADYRERNLDKVRAYDRLRANGPERVALRQQVAARWGSEPELRARSQQQKDAWAGRNKEKRIAHFKVNNAIRDGKLRRQPCQRCGREDAEAHHDDYSKPLDVVWLCPPHHGERHRELHAARRGEP